MAKTDIYLTTREGNASLLEPKLSLATGLVNFFKCETSLGESV